MEIEEILKKIDNKKSLIDNLHLPTNKILRFVPKFRLDWGSDEEGVSDEYNIGVTKPILLSTLSDPSHRLFHDPILFQNNKLAHKLLDTFIINKSLSKNLLLQIHSKIIPNGGKWRNREVFVSDQTYATKEFFSDTSEIENQVSKLIEWYNKETKINELHPIILATIFHYKFVKIHPFLDGNGRLARIISSLILLSYRLPPPIINNQDRATYIFCLRKADLDDLSPLTNFIGERVLASMDFILKSNSNENE